MTTRFLKISDDGAELPLEAVDWAAVREPARGLMWTKDEIKVKNYAGLEKAIAKFNDKKIGGFDDWRAPAVEELFLLADRSRHSPAIDTDFFPTCKSDWYWTATPAALSPSDYAWLVYFYDGNSYWSNHDGSGFVRAVRASQ